MTQTYTLKIHISKLLQIFETVSTSYLGKAVGGGLFAKGSTMKRITVIFGVFTLVYHDCNCIPSHYSWVYTVVASLLLMSHQILVGLFL